MPTYTYRCTNGHDIEAVQSFTDDPLTVCPTCGAALRKTYNSVGVVFKGSGFYRNDSRGDGKSSVNASSEGKSNSSSSDGAGKSADGGGSNTKSDSAPAAKSSSPSSTGSGASSGSGSSGAASSGSAA